MKPKIVVSLILIPIIIAGVLLVFGKTPLPRIPQSRRCLEICNRRDEGLIDIPMNASKEEVRRILGDPQNTDQDSDVWLWLTEWEVYERSGLARDWKTMSHGIFASRDGLWIGFDEHGRIRTPLWSLSAADPPARDYHWPPR